MFCKKNIYKFIVSFESIVISSMIPINLPIPSIDKIYKIAEIPINYQIPTIIFLTLILSGEFLIRVYAFYLLIGLFCLPIFFDGGSLGYLITPNFGYLIGIFPLIKIINILNLKKDYSFFKFIRYTLTGLIIMHLTGILYLCLQLLIFNKPDLILYSIGLFTLSKVPYQILVLVLVFISIKLINKLKSNEYIF